MTGRLPLPGTEHLRYQTPSGLYFCEACRKYVDPHWIRDAAEKNKPAQAACFDCICEEQGLKDLEFAKTVAIEGQIVFDGEFGFPCGTRGCENDWDEECYECQNLYCKECMRGAICKDCLADTWGIKTKDQPKLLTTGDLS